MIPTRPTARKISINRSPDPRGLVGAALTLALSVPVGLVALLILSGCSLLGRDRTPSTLIDSRVPIAPIPADERFVTRQEPEYFTHRELVEIGRAPEATGELHGRLFRFFRTPTIDNSAHASGRPVTVANNHDMGPFLRLATWNVEKSREMGRVIDALTSRAAYERMIDTEVAPPGSVLSERMLRQRRRLAESDIILLQEMDVGVPRSGYADAAGELARALGLNYAYAPQYLEVDPVILGLQGYYIEGKDEPIFNAVDPERYKGVFGSAVLSRYPIRAAKVFPLDEQPYDWYEREIEEYGPLEQMRRTGGRLLFENTIERELKVGGRHFFRVDLHVPGLPDETLTIINIHLEIKSRPEERERQMTEILSYIGEIRNPVIMAGDFNSAPHDLSATSVGRVVWRGVTNPYNWASLLINLTLSAGTVINNLRLAANTAKNFHSPLAPHIPLLMPNKVRPMMNMIRDFRFADGGAFDFRGDPARSIYGVGAMLSNSNEKTVKGHVGTFRVKRPLGPIGIYRLDWIFVKPPLPPAPPPGAARDDNSSDPADHYRLAPHFGETLVEFNRNMIQPFSDHRPCVVDLPLYEPVNLR